MEPESILCEEPAGSFNEFWKARLKIGQKSIDRYNIFFEFNNLFTFLSYFISAGKHIFGY